MMFRRFSDPEDFVSSMDLRAPRYQSRARNGFQATIMRSVFSDIVVSRGTVSSALTMSGATGSDCTLLFDTAPGADRIMNGRPLLFGEIYHPGSNDGYLVRSAPREAAWTAVTLPYDTLRAATIALSGRDLAPSRTSSTLTGNPPPALGRLILLSKRIEQLAERGSARPNRPDMSALVHGLLAQALTATLLRGEIEADRAARGKRRRIMARLEEIGESLTGEPVTLDVLCATLGVNARTLRLITHEFTGMGPVEFLRMHRLTRARRALAIADPRTAKVGDIAAAFGFWESGRFAALYRATFGETPMDTLRRR